MTAEQRLAAAKAFWLDEQGANEQMQAVFLIAQQKKFRPKSVVSLDEDRKARHLASLATVPDVVAGRALIAYHLADQRPMMGAFLDALEIKHENGVIEEEEVTPDPAKIPPAVQAIAGQFPREDVSLYLNTLFCQDPDTWKALADAPERGE
jgi:hypothetical protein